MALDTFNPYLFVSAGEQSNKFLTPTYADGIAHFQAQRAQSLTGLTVRIDPIQEGTGDPSPDNIRPISGRTECVTIVSGSNIIDDSLRLSSRYSNEVRLTKGTWYAQAFVNAPSRLNSRLQYLDGGGSWLEINTAPLNTDTFTLTAVSSIANPFGWMFDNGTYRIEVSETTKFRFVTASLNGTRRLSISSVRLDSFVEYNDTHTFTTDLGQTVYGGTLDVVSGVLTVTDAQIASYAGETLPGEWISDRDVYVAGTTPTTGAQVVYKLATPQTYQLSPTDVQTLAGFNQIYSDAGQVIDIKF